MLPFLSKVLHVFIVVTASLLLRWSDAVSLRGSRNGTAWHIDNLFVINLRYRTDRWAWTSAEFRKQGLSPIRREAVSGKDLISLVRERVSPWLTKWNDFYRDYQVHTVPRHTKLARGAVDPTLIRVDYNVSWLAKRVPGYNASKPLVLSPGEVGCILSHLKLWREIASRDSEMVSGRGVSCVFEDDVKLTPNFSSSLHHLLAELPRDADLLYLSYADLDGEHDVRFSEHLFVPRLLVVTQAYCLTAKGATALLRRLPVVGALDVWMAQQFAALRTFAARPKLVGQHQDVVRGDSDIEHTANQEAKVVKGDIEPMARWWIDGGFT